MRELDADDLDGEKLEEAVRRLRDGIQPEAIYLYGSHAYGQPHEDSDVDLLIIVSSLDEPHYEAEARAYRLLAGMRFPVELRIVSRKEFEKRRTWIASIEREVDERGVSLYAAG